MRITTPWQTTSAGRSPRSTSARAARHARALLGERLAAGEGEVRVAVDEAGEAVGVFGVYVAEQAVGPVARVGLHQARVLARLQTDPRAHDVRGFAGAQQRTAPQADESESTRPCARALGQIGCLGAPRIVERDRQVTLKATLQVVCGLAVAGQVDARGVIAGDTGCAAPRRAGLGRAGLSRSRATGCAASTG